MNKSQLINAISASSGASKSQTAVVLEGFFSVVTTALAEGDSVSVTGFGTFIVKDRKGRAGRNPKTGDVVEIAARRHPTFKAGKKLKDTVAHQKD